MTANQKKSSGKIFTLGVWLGFDYKLSIKREGIGRFVKCLHETIYEQFHPSYEIWVDTLNYKDIEQMFTLKFPIYTQIHFLEYIINEFLSQVLFLHLEMFSPNLFNWKTAAYRFKTNTFPAFTNRPIIYSLLSLLIFAGISIKLAKIIFHYKRFRVLLLSTLIFIFLSIILTVSATNGFWVSSILNFIRIICTIIALIGGINLIIALILKYLARFKREHIDLVYLANKYSQVDCFHIPIISLRNALKLKFSRVLTAHDLYPVVFKEKFLKEKLMSKESIAELLESGKEFVKQKVYFCSNSASISKQHFFDLIPNLRKSQAGYIFLPVISLKNIDRIILPEELIRNKFKLTGNYLFYPTQLRPHKNIKILLQLLKEQIVKDNSLKLVLTADYHYISELNDYIQTQKLENQIIVASDVSESELYSLYKYAFLTIVTTLSEGGFPWQTLESMLMGTPVITSDIEVVRERMEYHGLIKYLPMLCPFDPLDIRDLVKQYKFFLNNQSDVLKTQQLIIKPKILEYTWKDTAVSYYELFQQQAVAQ